MNFSTLSLLDDLLLTLMAYDHFEAICHSALHSHHEPSACGLLVLVSWIISALISLLQSLLVLRLSCTDLEIPKYFCDINQVIKLAHSDTFLNDTVMYFGARVLGGDPLAGILLL